ncbi:MAG: hypothetical protein IJB33_00080 [Akkermansia sp.]|nr:hypothetical protein [Akkermansia sp.]MBQ7022221.1 hypothetical protein [Akkermansia sp.]
MTNSASQVMFMGNYAHKLDPKNRVAVPAGWRSVYGQELVMLASSYHDKLPILKFYTQESFATKLDEIRESALAAGHEMGEVDEYIGSIAGQSFPVEVNNQGKLLIPKAQREYLGLKDQAQLIGRNKHFEIWKPSDFEAENTPQLRKENPLDKKFRML